MRSVLAAIALLILPTSVYAQGVRDYLPASGVIQGEVMVPAATQEFEALSQRLVTAFTANAAWLAEYLAQTAERPLPYHENFGVTREEYGRYLALSAAGGIFLRRVTSIEITWSPAADGSITFKSNVPGFPLDRVTISGNGEYVETPYGRSAPASVVRHQDSVVVGRWTGLNWRISELTSISSRLVMFSIGRIDDSGRGMIVYTVNSNVSGASERFDLSVLYGPTPVLAPIQIAKTIAQSSETKRPGRGPAAVAWEMVPGV